MPAGLYAKAALEKLGAWAAAEPKLAQAENVRATLAFVARGETPLGIVYETDAKVEPKVKIVGVFPGRLASAGHLSGGGDGDAPSPTPRSISHFLRIGGSQGDLREIRLQLPDQADVVMATDADALMLDLISRRNGPRSRCRCASRWSRPSCALPFGIAIA